MIEINKGNVVLSLDEYFNLLKDIESLKDVVKYNYDKGFNDGFDVGVNDGYDDGLTDGYKIAKKYIKKDDDDLDLNFLNEMYDVANEVVKNIFNKKGDLK